TAVSMRSTRPSKRLSWKPRKPKPPIMITATMPTTQRVLSIEPFNPSRRASTDARQPSHVPDGGGSPFPPSVLVIPPPPLASIRACTSTATHHACLAAMVAVFDVTLHGQEHSVQLPHVGEVAGDGGGGGHCRADQVGLGAGTLAALEIAV